MPQAREHVTLCADANEARLMTSTRHHARVRDCMHPGILSCSGDAPLGEVAGIMAKHRVHAVAVTNGEPRRVVGVASDLDVIGAAAGRDEPTASQIAATEPLTISANAPIDHAAQLMSEHGVAHLVVVDAASGSPVGILSTLDLAALYAS
jgi:CBS domain-containing protein